MNYATDYTVILSFLYLVAVAIAFAPKSCKTSAVDKIEYFPEVESVEPEPKNDTVTHFKPVTGIPVSISSPEPMQQPEPAIAPEISLTSLGIRELKKLASQAKIKRYSNLNKRELILALS
jgi:hypothetical protein